MYMFLLLQLGQQIPGQQIPGQPELQDQKEPEHPDHQVIPEPRQRQEKVTISTLRKTVRLSRNLLSRNLLSQSPLLFRLSRFRYCHFHPYHLSSSGSSGHTGTQATAGKSHNINFTEDSYILWPVNGAVIMSYSMDKTVYFQTLDQYKYNPAVIIEGAEGDQVLCGAPGIVKSIDVRCRDRNNG